MKNVYLVILNTEEYFLYDDPDVADYIHENFDEDDYEFMNYFHEKCIYSCKASNTKLRKYLKDKEMKVVRTYEEYAAY